jgi:hypothetical protein
MAHEKLRSNLEELPICHCALHRTRNVNMFAIPSDRHILHDNFYSENFFFFRRFQGHDLARELIAEKLQTTLITDAAVFAMISRVNMVCFFFVKIILSSSSLSRVQMLVVCSGFHQILIISSFFWLPCYLVGGPACPRKLRR